MVPRSITLGTLTRSGPVNGDIVILAVYYAALKDILAEYADEFAGKTVVDTSPIRQISRPSTRCFTPPESSSAAELAAALPSSQVIKAFNTTFAGTLSAKEGGPDNNHGAGSGR